jgi:dipeptidyl aminopeptidase/acylaminoacyl peptidase
MLRSKLPPRFRNVTRAPARFVYLRIVVFGAAWIAGSAVAADDAGTSPQQRRGTRGAGGDVYKAQLVPHWFHNATRFWYRNDLRGGAKEFILVDVEKGSRQSAFDHPKLAAALSKAAGMDFRSDRLPFENIEFTENQTALRFEAAGKTWKCSLSSYECSEAGGDASKGGPPDGKNASALPKEPQRQRGVGPPRRTGPGRSGPGDPARPLTSPDGKRSAFLKEHNIFVRSGEHESQWTTDGEPTSAYGRFEWSPDSRALVAWRIRPGERKEVYLIRSSPPGGGRATLQSRPYDLPGDKFTTYELHVFEAASGKRIASKGESVDFGTPRLRWSRDGRRFAYQKVDRGHQRFRVIEVDTHTGAARNVIDERTDTFIWTAHTENLRLNLVNWLDKTDEVIYVSERDGWRQLYLLDVHSAEVKQITKGEFVVRGIDRIDEEQRQVWFHASGRNPAQDPYLIHYYRVNFDGTGLTALTEGNGHHTIQFSPDRRYLIDTYSRVDLPPVNELRRVSNGQLICKLEEADISELKARGWEPPEVFVAKGRDGKTDIWGIICRPANFDPAKKYPVIEDIYAGPQGSFVPKTFSPLRRYASLTDLGFIVVKIDGMGTANRSKAFHDVCWKDLKDAGFPDRILWHQAAAAKYPSYDLSRVGIYGTSAGGQNAAAAVLFHPQFYKVAVAACGCHDNRLDKASWNEQWMGYPVGSQYAASSNIQHAHLLRGKLLLIVGEMDTNVPPESTMRFADALIKAGKDFDLLVVPGAGHGPGGSYGIRRRDDFFVRHLLGVEPPDRNAGTRPAGR